MTNRSGQPQLLMNRDRHLRQLGFIRASGNRITHAMIDPEKHPNRPDLGKLKRRCLVIARLTGNVQSQALTRSIVVHELRNWALLTGQQTTADQLIAQLPSLGGLRLEPKRLDNQETS